MHETRLVNSIVSELLNRNLTEAKLRLGRMHCRADVFRSLFREQTRGTPLENMRLEVEEVPVKIKCKCGFQGNVSVMEHIHFVRCPECHDIVEPLTGNELEIIY
jgi:Zn finger protein HypA/HybF involved in hydrogenase expression